MFKKTMLATVLAATSFSSFANWVSGASYINLSEDLYGKDLSFGILAASVGYQFKTGDKFQLTPEFRMGTGIKDDTYSGVNLKINRFISFSVRGEYDFSNDWYAYLAPSYTNLKVKAARSGVSATNDEWEFGFNTGIGLKATESTSVELVYEKYNDTDMLGASVKVQF